ncbi:UDP-glycosyltransferase 82A1-like [Chenopodium quinoa]|uniref:Glycosyltransferase n=1 Tax=Chenopodium quinoa TaxID=63459 RepID=A0A803LEN8_CHEQI|nr:UDP-glycosyltransferase 82A1-like [Chenopodium quinoa]
MVYDEPKKKMIILVPYPAQGHVTPMLKLASSLSTFGFRPLVVLPEFIHRLIFNKVNAATKGGIVCVSIPDGLDDESKSRDFFNIEKAMEDHMPPYMERLIRKTNNNGGENIACMVVDLLASWAFDVGTKCGVAVAGFWPAMLATYSLISSIPELVQRGLISEYGLPQFHGPISFQHDQPLLKSEDLPWLIGTQAAKKARFKFWAKTMDRSRSLRWILVNSFPNESQKVWAKNPEYSPTTYSIGPLGSNGLSESLTFWEADGSCLGWLEQQEPNSVIYISFGSWVSPIGEAKVRNLALALEELKSPIVWVLGPEWRDGLPKGYIERLGKQGKIVAWAPQLEVLQHKAVGCYLTHCGWNSTMEAIQGKKCLLCFPVAGDQSLNCEYIVNVWKIGVKMNGFSVKDVSDGVKRVMEDREMKKRIEALNMRVMGEKASLEVKDNLFGFMNDLKRPINALQFNL